MQVADKDPNGWQVFELARAGIWDLKKCAYMPTVCKLLRNDNAVSGRIPLSKVESINANGGWLPPDPASVWLEPSFSSKRLPLDVATIENSNGYIPDQVVAILRLAPKAHLMAHIGTSNARLNLHVGLQVPDGAQLRVANQTSTWVEGKAIVFDESFEHEAWNGNAEIPRYVLQVHTWHPGLMPLVEAPPQPGTIKWTFETGDAVNPQAALSNDGNVLYAGSNDKKLYAINAETGVKLWHFNTGAFVDSPPSITEDGRKVYVGSRTTTMHLVNAFTGVELQTFPAGGGEKWASSPAHSVDQKSLFVGSYDTNLYSIKEGTKAWAFETKGAVYSSPTCCGNNGTIVYVGSDDNFLYAINADTGEQVWGYETGDWVYSTPLLNRDATLVYCTSYDAYIYALDAVTGAEVWRFKTGGFVDASPVLSVDGTTLYMSSVDNNVYGVDAATGTVRVVQLLDYCQQLNKSELEHAICFFLGVG